VAWEDSRRLQLDMKLRLQTTKGSLVLNCLIDTGAQVNLIKRGLVQSPMVSRASQLIRLFTADGSAMAGGDQVVQGRLHMQAVERARTVDGRGSCAVGEPEQVSFPAVAYLADIWPMPSCPMVGCSTTVYGLPFPIIVCFVRLLGLTSSF
jgi:hypothetical protein